MDGTFGTEKKKSNSFKPLVMQGGIFDTRDYSTTDTHGTGVEYSLSSGLFFAEVRKLKVFVKSQEMLPIEKIFFAYLFG